MSFLLADLRMGFVTASILLEFITDFPWVVFAEEVSFSLDVILLIFRSWEEGEGDWYTYFLLLSRQLALLEFVSILILKINESLYSLFKSKNINFILKLHYKFFRYIRPGFLKNSIYLIAKSISKHQLLFLRRIIRNFQRSYSLNKW